MNLVSLPLLYKQGYKYQGIVKCMGLPHLLIGTIPALIYLLYRLNIIPNKTNNIITKQSNKYLYFIVYIQHLFGPLHPYLILWTYIHGIKGDKKVVRTQKKRKELKDMNLLNDTVSEEQWIYQNGQLSI